VILARLAASLLAVTLCAAAPAHARSIDAEEAASVILTAELLFERASLQPADMVSFRAAITARLAEVSGAAGQACIDHAAPQRDRGAAYAVALDCIDFAALSHADRDRLLRATIVAGLQAGGDAEGAVLHEADFAQFDEIDQAGAVGLQFIRTDGTTRIVSVLPNGAAAGSAIEPGSVIVAIDGKPTEAMADNEIAVHLRGPIGSVVTLQIADQAGAVRDHVFERIDWQSHATSVTAFRAGPDLVMRSADYFTNSAALFRETPRQMESQLASHPGASHVILDLRGNTGGALETAIQTADLFVAKGQVGALQEPGHRKIETTVRWQARSGEGGENRRVTVLVDGQTAAGAELIAAALADNRRARIVGQPTYGRGSVQTLFPVGQGYFLKLTTARLIRPSGAGLDAKVVPDCEVAELPAEGPQLIEALEALLCP
jgi:carboxyl-terminal processing protease